MTWDVRDYGKEEERPGVVGRLVQDEPGTEAPDGAPEEETPTNQLLRMLSDPMAPPVTWRPPKTTMAMRLEMSQFGLVPDGDWARIRRHMTRGIMEE